MNSTRVTAIVDEMMKNDLFSQWLAVERLGEAPGYCKLKMTIRPEMCNGFGMAHGGIVFSLADSALAFASNSHGRQAVSIENSISYINFLYAGDKITATATEKSLNNKIARYDVTIEKETGELIAIFRGTVYIKSK